MTDFSMPRVAREQWMERWARSLGWRGAQEMRAGVLLIRARVESLDPFSTHAVTAARERERDRCHAIAADLARKMLDGKPKHWRYHHDTAVRIAELISAGANT